MSYQSNTEVLDIYHSHAETSRRNAQSKRDLSSVENRVFLLTRSMRSGSIGGDVSGAAIGVLSTDQISLV
jgi:hypothetical protein